MSRPAVLLALRLAAGGVFVVFGVGKFVNHASELASFHAYRLPAPGVFVYAIGVIELVGGLLLIVGLATRPAALVLAGEMIGAIVVSGIGLGELVSLTLAPAELAACLFIAWNGPGMRALDRPVRSRGTERRLTGRAIVPSLIPVRGRLGIWGAEAAGTAALVLGALSAVAFVLGEGSPLARLPMSLRLAVTGLLVGVCVALIAVSPLGRLSGAHINPAVTLGFFIVRMVPSRDLFGYIGAQLTGAVVGAYLFRWSWGHVALSVAGGVTHPSVSVPAALALEAGMTALLMAMILLFLSRARLTRWTPLMLVPLLALLVWRGSSYTGTSLNPARSEGPAIAFGDLADLWLYFVGPVLGAAGVATTWRCLTPAWHPLTAKLFHDPRYPCALRAELAVRGGSTGSASCRARRPAARQP